MVRGARQAVQVGFSRSLPQPDTKVTLPPSGVRADGQGGPWREGVTIGVENNSPAKQARASAVYIHPQTHPLLLHHLAPDFQISLDAQSCVGLGSGRVPPLLLRHAPDKLRRQRHLGEETLRLNWAPHSSGDVDVMWYCRSRPQAALPSANKTWPVYFDNICQQKTNLATRFVWRLLQHGFVDEICLDCLLYLCFWGGGDGIL